MHLELRLLQDVQALLKRLGERFAADRISLLVSNAQRSRLLTDLLAKHNLTEGGVGTPYELDGYYPAQGGRLTLRQCEAAVRDLEEEIDTYVDGDGYLERFYATTEAKGPFHFHVTRKHISLGICNSICAFIKCQNDGLRVTMRPSRSCIGKQVDAIRAGKTREYGLAVEELKKRILEK